jgi:hypothetical protein
LKSKANYPANVVGREAERDRDSSKNYTNYGIKND